MLGPRLLLSLGGCLLVCAAGWGVVDRGPGTFILTSPPPIIEGRVYVPARQFCAWVGASLTWRSEARSLTITWRGVARTWSAGQGSLLLRAGRAFVSIREFAEAFGGSLTYHGELKAVHYRGPKRDVHAAFPIGWRPPRQPPGLSQEEAEVWRFFAPPLPGLRAPRNMLWQPTDIRISQRWAAAKLHPLNLITDDCQAIAEKRNGSWRLLAAGTDVGSDGNTYGIPEDVRRNLGLYFGAPLGRAGASLPPLLASTDSSARTAPHRTPPPSPQRRQLSAAPAA